MPSYPTSASRALLAGRCPRCHQGRLFSAPLRQVTRFADMPPACPACGQTYEPEPGFYYGAMYFSFGFSVATMLGVGAAVYVLGNDPPVSVYVLAVALASLVLTPLSYRASRALMLYLFGGVRFDPVVAEQVAAGTYQIPEARPPRRRA